MSKARFFNYVEKAKRCLDDLLTDKPALMEKKRLIGEELENDIISMRMEKCLNHIQQAGMEYGKLSGIGCQPLDMFSPLGIKRGDFILGGMSHGLNVVN